MGVQMRHGISYGGNANIASAIQYDSNHTVETIIGKVIGDISSVESSATATSAHAKGNYLVYNGQFYKATKAIAVGDTLTVGTNITSTNVGSELATLNTAVSTLNSESNNYISFQNNAGFHNAIYRGKYLGSSLTSAQSTAIQAGTFDDLFVGDYWTIDGVNYRIADCDYFYKSGDTECTTHHILVVPDTALYNAQMNKSDTTEAGYMGSAMYSTNLNTAKTTITSAFGSEHILTHREYLCNSVSSGRPNSGIWRDSSIELMSESMVYGSPYFESAAYGYTIPAIHTVACKQLNLFRYRPDLISNRIDYWLRNIVSTDAFAFVTFTGISECAVASRKAGVRPVATIY